MRTIRLLIAFDGTDYHGWQLQPDAPTIQGALERILAIIHERHVTVHGAGRTDAGVHATGMVAHFHSDKAISCTAFKNSLNSMLPGSIRILEATEELPSFHARFSAKRKTYRYTVFNGEVLLPQQRLYAVHVRSALDKAAMERCLATLVGTHDFASFETAGSRDISYPGTRGSIRTIYEASIIASSGESFYFSITGDGFLRHMVRNIVGTILEVGQQRRSVAAFLAAFRSADRSQAGCTAPPHGLTLHKIYY